MKKLSPAPLLALLLLLSLAGATSAQGLVDVQATRNALTTFPDSQAVLFVNVQRIIRDTLPKVMPPGELEKAIAEAQKVGVDIRGIEYMVVGVRLTDPPSPSGAPEVVVLLKGNFSADALMSLARLGLGTQGISATEESYNSKTINIVNLSEAMKPKDGAQGSGGGGGGASNFPYKEVGATALDANTLVIGVPSYVRATIDAVGAGGSRLKSGLVDLAVTNPNALTSLTIEVPANLPEYLRKTGMPRNEEMDRIIGWLRQLSFSTGMTATDFNLQAAIRTDAAEHANAISGMIRMGLAAAESAAKADVERKRANPRESKESRAALAALSTFVNRTEGDTVRLSVSVPQQTIADLMKKTPPPAAAPEGKGKAPVTRRARRRPARRG